MTASWFFRNRLRVPPFAACQTEVPTPTCPYCRGEGTTFDAVCPACDGDGIDRASKPSRGEEHDDE